MSTIYTRSDKTSTHPSGERVVVFHQVTRDSIVLNPTGSLIWEALTTSKTREQLLTVLSEAYPEVPQEALESDLDAYLTELGENQLVVVSG